MKSEQAGPALLFANDLKISTLLRTAISLPLLLGCMVSQVASQKDVVQQFVNLDVKGLRLTPQGWMQADALFTRHTEPSRPKFVVVIARRYAVSQDTTKKNYFVLGYDDVGHIDTSTLRFTPTHIAGVMWSYKGYTVVPRATHERNASTWLIEGAQPDEMYLPAAVAIRWASEVHDKTSDPTIRKNSDQTIVAIKPYR